MKLTGFTNKKSMVTLLAVAGVSVVMVGVSLVPRDAQGEFDLDSLNSQVQNHEARIGNTEKDVEKLQNETNVAPAENKTTVPVTTTSTTNNTTQPAAAPSPAPAEAEPVPVQPVAPTHQTSMYVSTGCHWKDFGVGPYFVWRFNDGHEERHADSGGKQVNSSTTCSNQQIPIQIR